MPYRESSPVSRRSFVTLAGAVGLAGLAALTGCTSRSSSQTTSTAASATASAADSALAESGPVLVAYYSATGHTRRVAEEIASRLGADLFEIVPADNYTNDDLNFNNTNSRVCREYDGRDSRDVPLARSAPDNFDSYQTVFVGYPIWWGGAAWPVNHFLEDNDFSGKTIVPFCTSQSSPIGNSATNLEQYATSGAWLTGQRFGENESAGAIDNWVDSLGIGQ